MPHPTLGRTHSQTWHDHQDDIEREWLDQWMRGLINPDTLEPIPTPTGLPALTVAA